MADGSQRSAQIRAIVMLEIAIILILILANGLLSMSEIAVVSARRARLQQRAAAGDEGAAVALELARAPNRFLSTIQIGITLIGVLTGAFSSSTIAHQLAGLVVQVPVLAPYAEQIGFAVVVVLISYLSLVLGELVPKRLGLNGAERLASAVARPMQALARAAGPAVWFLSASTDAVLRLMRVQLHAAQPVTEEEIKLLLEQGAEAGVFEEAEHELLEGVLDVADLRASALMTPRHLIAGFDVEDPVDENLRRIRASGHSYFPVYEGSLDEVLGVVSVRDLWDRSVGGEPFDVRASLLQPLFVPESMPALHVLEQFKQTGVHIALVTDEYGSIQGLVTLIDVMEAIVGDVTPPGAGESLPAVQRADGSWLLDGLLGVAEVKEVLGLSFLPNEEDRYYQTLGGFIMSYLGRIPALEDQFDWAGYRFEVIDLDGHRVDKVLVTPLTRSIAPGEAADGTEPAR